MKIRYDKDKVGKNLYEKYGIPEEFVIFRYAQRENMSNPKARFVVSFQLKNMKVEKNIKFSNIPMHVLVHFSGFTSKYWLMNCKTNTCIGVYQWATIEDAKRYSESIAMRFMKKRSVPGSVRFHIYHSDEIFNYEDFINISK